MTYNFVKHFNTKDRGTSISIAKQGLLRLSAGFMRVANIKDKPFVILYWDKNSMTIALQFVENQKGGALRVTEDTSAATISIKSFMRFSELDLDQYIGKYNWEKTNIDNIGEVYIVKLTSKH